MCHFRKFVTEFMVRVAQDVAMEDIDRERLL